MASRLSLAFALLLAARVTLGAPQVGEQPPSYVGYTLSGQRVELDKQPGKAIVVSFWATWCPYCLKEIDVLNKIQNVGGGRVQVIMVNTESVTTFGKVARALDKLKLKLQLTNDTDGAASKAFGVEALPHMFIIGRDGKIVSIYRGYSEKELDGIIAAINAAMGD